MELRVWFLFILSLVSRFVAFANCNSFWFYIDFWCKKVIFFLFLLVEFYVNFFWVYFNL